MKALTALDEAALRAREYARKEDHKQAAKFRRLTRLLIVREESNPELNRKLLRVMAISAALGIIIVMILVKFNVID